MWPKGGRHDRRHTEIQRAAAQPTPLAIEDVVELGQRKVAAIDMRLVIVGASRAGIGHRPSLSRSHRLEAKPADSVTVVTDSSIVDAVVVGAGLAGLSAARALHRAGRSVVVVEASDGVGGRVRTDTVDGFTLDRGFQILLTAYPALRAELDLDALELRRFDPGAVVRTGSKFHRVADPRRRPTTIVSSALAPVGSLADKARMGLLLRRVGAAAPTALLREPDRSTLDGLRAAGFGPAMIDRFWRPLLGGIQLDPELGASWRMAQVVLHCLAVGDAAVPARGMQAIPEQMAAALPPGVVRLGAAVTRVEPQNVHLATGEQLRARRIVIATEGPVASALLGRAAVASRSASAVWFAADHPPLDDRAIVLDGTGTGPATNVVILSNVAPEYAPPGRALIVAACPGVDDAGIEPAVRAQMRRWFGSTVDSWTHLRTDAIAHAHPAAPLPLAPKRRVDLGNGLYVCGDHRDTPSIQGALFSGRRVADAVLASLA
jgi:phytoene dehydrogenase-like protein